MRKVIVFGGTGWVGNHIVLELAAHGYDVTIASRGQKAEPYAVLPPASVRRVVVDKTSESDMQKLFEEKFDFVFIDANKREYVKYFELVKPHLTPKALIVADNITSHAEKVQTFIDAVDADDEFQYEIVEVPGGILVAYRG